MRKFCVPLKSHFFSAFCVFGSYFRTLSVNFVADFLFLLGGGGGGGVRSVSENREAFLSALFCFNNS